MFDMTEIDLTGMTLPEVRALKELTEAEIRRRDIVFESEVKAEALATDYLIAVGRTPGSEWVQPVGAHDAYPVGFEVEFEGKGWTSLLSGNVWKPGVTAWREASAEGANPPTWVQPLGAHDSYSSGFAVSFEDAVWVSLVNGNVWPPSSDPTLWVERVAPEPEPEEPEEPEVPEEPETPPETEAPAEFVQPTGAHDAYKVGDKVTFNGKVYQSNISANVYSPTAYPAGWTLVS